MISFAQATLRVGARIGRVARTAQIEIALLLGAVVALFVARYHRAARVAVEVKLLREREKERGGTVTGMSQNPAAMVVRSPFAPTHH